MVICRERRQRQENPKVLLTRGPGIGRGEKQRDLDSNKKGRSVLLVVFETPSWVVVSGCLHVHP